MTYPSLTISGREKLHQAQKVLFYSWAIGKTWPKAQYPISAQAFLVCLLLWSLFMKAGPGQGWRVASKGKANFRDHVRFFSGKTQIDRFWVRLVFGWSLIGFREVSEHPE